MQLLHGDCLELLPSIPDNSIDMVLADPPYGTTACRWDSIIPLEPMWKELKRVTKKRGAIVMTASQPFTTTLIASNMKMFKYCWYWSKSKPNGWQHAKNKPMTKIEDVCVFSKAPMGHYSQLGEKRMTYFPQGVASVGKKTVTAVAHGRSMGARLNQIGREYEAFTGFPHNLLEYQNIIGSKAIHPTQKPVALMEYLIKTYTNENDTVLDFCIGSGSTGVAAVNLNRNFIGIEKELDYYNIACDRINQAQEKITLFHE